MHIFALPIAEIAQLVEHDLAKVGVASSSLVFRSSVSLTSVGLFRVYQWVMSVRPACAAVLGVFVISVDRGGFPVKRG